MGTILLIFKKRDKKNDCSKIKSFYTGSKKILNNIIL